MTQKKQLSWRRNKTTTSTVRRLRTIIKKAGFTEELSIVPLLHEFSVVVSDGNCYNVRISKETFEISSVERLHYTKTKNGLISQVTAITA